MGHKLISTKTNFDASGGHAQHTLGRVDGPIVLTLQPNTSFAASTHSPTATISHVIDDVSARFDLLLTSAALKVCSSPNKSLWPYQTVMRLCLHSK
jgi:hypothetical protein